MREGERREPGPRGGEGGSVATGDLSFDGLLGRRDDARGREKFILHDGSDGAEGSEGSDGADGADGAEGSDGRVGADGCEGGGELDGGDDEGGGVGGGEDCCGDSQAVSARTITTTIARALVQ